MLGAASLAAQPPSDLDELLARFARLPGVSARFEEEKRIALLMVPVRSTGEIHFAPPGLLLRRVTAPTPSAALIGSGRITLVSPGRREELDLGGNPVVAGFVDSFRYVLAGDRAGLERAYQLSYDRGTADDWVLTLRPRTAALQQFLRELVLRGEGTAVRSMTMTEASGDVTETRFTDVRTRSWSDAERHRVFRL